MLGYIEVIRFREGSLTVTGDNRHCYEPQPACTVFRSPPHTTLLHLCGAAFFFMGNPKPIECAECLRSMAHVKSELLTRIACANCQYAQESVERSEEHTSELQSLTK